MMIFWQIWIIFSNTVTAYVLLPILADLLLTICQNPLYLIKGAALTSSYTFMLPPPPSPQRHRVQGLHQYHLPYGHGGGSKHNGFGGGLEGNMKA